MSKSKKLIFLFALIFYGVVTLLHAPWTRYETKRYTWTKVECNYINETSLCSRAVAHELHFHEWRTYNPVWVWMGNVKNFIATLLIISVCALMSLIIFRDQKA